MYLKDRFREAQLTDPPPSCTFTGYQAGRIPSNCTTAAFLHVCISSLCVCTIVCM